MTSRTLTIIIVIIGFVVLAGGGFFLFGRNQETPQPASQTAQTPQITQTIQNNNDQLTEKKSFKELIQVGSNQQCSFQDTQTDSSGTVYITNGKFRGDFISKSNNTTVNSHMISDKGDIYIWMDGNSNGFKSSLEAVGQLGTSGKTNNGVDINKQVDIVCYSWSPDSSQFTLPTNIKFTDIGNLIPTGISTASGTLKVTPGAGNAAACAACNSLSGESKTQCLTTLKCN